MSWPLASFVIVFAVLAMGWLAYERSRPSARMVAVVGTLAATAALGRDAFVALPDVKPITAMTLVVGYALGPLPGFAVGAVGMLASNIVLGQGPYTPWQMAAWGLVGLFGAALGRLAGGRVGRVWLALACALSALAAKEIMNVYEWTVSASHTLPSLALTVSKGVPFDVTDAAASFLFALAFGPELARLLTRTRERMAVAWEPPTPAAVLLALVIIPLSGGLARPQPVSAKPPVQAARSPSRPGPVSPRYAGVRLDRRTPASASATAVGAAARIAAFLERSQNADGGFGGAPGERSSELYSAWAALGLAAAGRDPVYVRRSGHSVLDAIRGEASTLHGAGDLERTILALHACGAAASLPGLGVLAARLERHREGDGSFERLVNITAFAVLALRADGRPASDRVLRRAAGWLEGQQEADGGFGYAGQGSSADVDDTGAAVQALAAVGRAGGAVTRAAVGYLLRSVNRDGGFPQQPGAESNAQSTAWALQALVAARHEVARPLPGARRSPLAYLQSLVAQDGSVRYSSSSSQTPVWVSAQTLTALALEPLPVDLSPTAPAPSMPATASAGRASPPTGRARRAQARNPATPPHSGLRGGAPRASAPAAELLRIGESGQAVLDRLARAAGELIGFALAEL